jgi:predicted metalloendopeptidase
VVNAFNDLAKNSIEFPAGVFEVPLFDMEAPMYINYGAIGSIIGHEITHGFDRAGMQFDAEGAMVNWWSNASVLQYENKSECYIKHFGKFKAGEKAINPLLSLGENVADSAGIKLAKMAYEYYAKQVLKESPLPGFAQFSPQQLFYIAFAQVWCDKRTEFQLEQTLLSDPHLPGEPRVSGTISLQPGFSKAFKCPQGSRMNPPQKCSMWSN